MEQIRIILVTINCLLAGLLAYPQSDDFTTDVNALNSLLKTIQTSKATLKQSVRIVDNNIVQFSQITQGSKGKTKIEEYRFNPSDLAPNLILQKTVGSEMNVKLQTHNSQNFVEVIRDEMVIGYRSDLSINAFDIDNSRAIVDAAIALIDAANVLETGKYKFDSYSQVIEKLSSSVGDLLVPSKVPGKEQEHRQSFHELPNKPGKIEYADEAKGVFRKYQFNLSDVDLHSTRIQIFLRNLSLNFTMKGNASIVAVEENGIRKAFENSVQIHPKDIENAKQIQMLLKMAIEMWREGKLANEAESPTDAATDDSQLDEPSTPAEESKYTGSGISKNKISTKEPEWAGEMVFVNEHDGTGIELEKQTASVKTKAGASVYLTGMGKVTSRASIRGGASPLRIVTSDTLFFVFRYENNTTSPRKVIELYQLEKKGKTRVLEVGSVGTFSGSSIGDMDRVNLVVEKYGKSSYRVMLVNPSPGEYGFTLGENETTDMDLFGLDPLDRGE